MRRAVAFTVGLLVAMVVVASPAWACGGLVNPNGTVSLLRTTTAVGYVDGIEHYITSFEFAGGGGEFGSIIPLPGVPTKVERAGDWTLQRLVREVTPVERANLLTFEGAASADSSARVLYETRIDALDITILEGGGDEVGRWAKDNGFSLTPDAPEVLDFYASRSPIFMAARFDATAAAEDGQQVGDGTPIHLTIPTPNPWVPLRILGLGVGPKAQIEADVFLLTRGVPNMLPKPVSAGEGMVLERSERASGALLADLRSDKGMGWLPEEGMWLSYLRIDAPAGNLRHDLAIDASGLGTPSLVAAGLVDPRRIPADEPREGVSSWWLMIALAGLVALAWQTGRGSPWAD